MDPAQEQAALVAWLVDHDEACPVCGYNVRGLTTSACPECAAPLRLGVTSPQHLLGPWLVAIIACSLALGFDGVVMTLLSIAVVFEAITRQIVSVPLALIGTFVTLGGVSGVALWQLIARRRQWRMAGPDVQWARAGAITVAIFLIHAVGGLTLMLAM